MVTDHHDQTGKQSRERGRESKIATFVQDGLLSKINFERNFSFMYEYAQNKIIKNSFLGS